MKIEDEFHQKAILTCIEKLCSNKTVRARTLIIICVTSNDSSKLLPGQLNQHFGLIPFGCLYFPFFVRVIVIVDSNL